MHNDETNQGSTNDDAVALLAEAAGITIAPDRLEIVAEFLREVRAADEQLRSLNLDGIAPDAVFDPSWPEDER